MYLSCLHSLLHATSTIDVDCKQSTSLCLERTELKLRCSTFHFLENMLSRNESSFMYLAAHEFDQGLPPRCDSGFETFTSAIPISSSAISIVSPIVWETDASLETMLNYIRDLRYAYEIPVCIIWLRAISHLPSGSQILDPSSHP